MKRLAIALSLLACCAPAWSAMGEYPLTEPVTQSDRWPAGLADLVNSMPRVESWWGPVIEDRFYYAGDTAAFQKFLIGYSRISTDDHVVVLKHGPGQSWIKHKPIDWLLLGEMLGAENAGKAAPSRLTIELWSAGQVRIGDVKLPANVRLAHETPCVSGEVKHGALPISLTSGAGLETGVLHYKSVSFGVDEAQSSSEASFICAELRGTMLSWPKGKWVVEIRLMNEKLETVSETKAVVENSGTIRGRPAITEVHHLLRLTPVVHPPVARHFRVCLRPATADERVSAELAPLPKEK